MALRLSSHQTKLKELDLAAVEAAAAAAAATVPGGFSW